VAVFAAGLVTSLSPCTLSVLPLTLGYIGGYAGARGQADGVLFLRCDVLHKLLYHYTRHVCRSMFACHLRSLGCMMPHCAGHCMCCMRVWAAQCTPGMYSLRSSAAMPLIMLRSRGRGMQTCASTCICVPQQRYRPGNTPAARTVVTGGPVQPCTAYDRAQLAGTAGR